MNLDEAEECRLVRRAPRRQRLGTLGRLGSSMCIEVGHVEAIFRYPVKSMAGERLEVANLGWYGLDGDRRLAFRRIDDRSGMPWVRSHPNGGYGVAICSPSFAAHNCRILNGRPDARRFRNPRAWMTVRRAGLISTVTTDL